MDHYHPDARSIITDLDVCLYDEDESHLHYIELKDSRKSHKEKDVWEKIEKVSRFFYDFDIDVSASELYYKEEHNPLEHHSREDLKQEVIFAEDNFSEDSTESLQDPLETMIESGIFTDSKAPYNAKNRLVPHSALSPENYELVDPEPPFAPEIFHPHYTVDTQLEQRFDQIPDREEVFVAYYSNRNPSEIEEQLEELPPNCNYLTYRHQSENTEKSEHLVITARQPIEQLFNDRLLPEQIEQD